MNNIIVKAKFNSLIMLLNSRERYSIVLGNHLKKWNKITKPVHWSTQGGDFQINYTMNVETVIT